MCQVCDDLRATKPVDPAQPVMVAGDPQWNNAAKRMEEGIPVGAGLFADPTDRSGQRRALAPGLMRSAATAAVAAASRQKARPALPQGRQPKVRLASREAAGLRAACACWLAKLRISSRPSVALLVQDLGRVGACLRGNRCDLAAVVDALLITFFAYSVFLATRSSAHRAAPCRASAPRTPRTSRESVSMLRAQRMCARHCGLVGLAQRLDVAALRRPDRLDIERMKAEIGKHLGHVEIKWVGASIGIASGFIPDGRTIVQRTMPYSVARHRPVKDNFAAQQNAAGSGVTARGPVARLPPPPPRCPQPALDAAKPSVKRRHGRRKIGRVVAQHTRRRRRKPSVSLPPRAAQPAGRIPAASSIHAIERKEPRRGGARRLGRSAIRDRALRAPPVRVAARRNAASADRIRGSRGASSSSAAASPGRYHRARLPRPPRFYPPGKPAKDCRLRRKGSVEGEDRQPGLGRDRRHRQPPPALDRAISAQRRVDQPVGTRCRPAPGVLPGASLAIAPASVRQLARARRRGGDSAVEQLRQPVLEDQNVERGAGRAARAGDILAQPRRRIGRDLRQLPGAGHRGARQPEAAAPAAVRRERRRRPAPRSAERHRPARCRTQAVTASISASSSTQALSPIAASSCSQSRRCPGSTCAIRAGDRDRAPDRRRRVRHAADDRRLISRGGGRCRRSSCPPRSTETGSRGAPSGDTLAAADREYAA